jgi:hypothetical protein
MSIEAPLSKYRKHNSMITIGILVVLAGWCYYDGYLNPEFAQEHTSPDGTPEGWLPFNRKSPPYLLLGAAVFAVRFWMVRNKKIVADDQGLHYDKLTISYDQIESINKTHFDSKGFFIVHYSDGGQKKELKFNDRQYDNLSAVLDHLVSKITS